MNPYQKALVHTYAQGDFSYVSTFSESSEVGDSLFHFLFCELSDEEGCNSKDEALRRLDNAKNDIEGVISAVDKAHDKRWVIDDAQAEVDEYGYYQKGLRIQSWDELTIACEVAGGIPEHEAQQYAQTICSALNNAEISNC